MIVLRTIADLCAWRETQSRIAFVPTMGAFHEGHLALMRHAKRLESTVLVSLFVNPLQFGPNEDYSTYPRDEERDFELARREGVDAIFAPDVEEMFSDCHTRVCVRGVSERFEGEFRPGHFDGVATVVLKLFVLARPNRAIFGLKDLQQCAVIRRMVYDLGLDVSLDFHETVREPVGLALSSRNAYLSPAEREIAPRLYRELVALRDRIRDLEPSSEQAKKEIESASDRLRSHGFAVDYVALVDPLTMEEPQTRNPEARLIAAVRLGTTRLIDNLPLEFDSERADNN